MTYQNKIFDVLKYFRDCNIDYITTGNKHCTSGWANIHCPFCTGSNNYHLGVHIATGAFKCWRCGSKKQIEVVKQLSHVDNNEAYRLCKLYRGLPLRDENREPQGVIKLNKPVELRLPQGCGSLKQQHRVYLEKRNFDSYKLEKEWGLQGTSYIGAYKHRIIAPIYLENKLISYQGRDITGHSDIKYKACKKDEELVCHQDMLYGIDFIRNRKACIVEGIADVWRLGKGSICTFGTSYTTAQVNMLVNKLDEAYILFDGLQDDANALKQANKLASLLEAQGIQVELLELSEGDPAELSQQEADDLMCSLKLI